MTTAERKERRRSQLLDGSVERMAALDDFESIVRMQERSAIAKSLRSIAEADPTYTLVHVADELEAMNVRRPAWA